MSHLPPPYPPQPGFGWAPPPPPPRRRWGRIVALVLALPVLGVGIGWGAVLVTKDDAGDPAACKRALAVNYRDAVRAGGGAEQMPEPSSCKGVPEAVLKRITGEVISEYLDSPEADEDMERLMESATP